MAARHTDNSSIACVVAFSAPIEYEGMVFYTDDELRRITMPKLLINSEEDDGADDNRKMFEIFRDPKKLRFYPGNAHGTQLFDSVKEAVTEDIKEFIKCALPRPGIT